MTLEGAQVFYELIKFKASIARLYCHVFLRLAKQLEAAVMKRKQFTWENFIWAHVTVLSRQNWIEVQGKEGKPTKSLALIPVYDLINHEGFGELTTDFDFEQQVLKTYAVKNFKKGEEIVMFYGDRPNTDFFLYNAFIPSSNPHNYITLELSLIESDKLFAEKKALLEKQNLPVLGKYIVQAEDNSISPEIMGFLRIAWCKNEEEVKQAANVNVQSEPISAAIDNVALSMLIMKLNQIEKHYKTTIEEDKKEMLLADLNLRNSLTLRIEEKTIFKRLKSLAEAQKNELKKNAT